MADYVNRVEVADIIDELACRLDPLAFDNPDIADMERRKRDAYMRIRTDMQEYERREFLCFEVVLRITDKDIPW